MCCANEILRTIVAKFLYYYTQEMSAIYSREPREKSTEFGVCLATHKKKAWNLNVYWTKWLFFVEPQSQRRAERQHAAA